MQFIDLANQFMPGYDLLSENQQLVFEQTEVGRRFVTVINEILTEVKSYTKNISFFSLIFGSFEQQKKNWSRKMKCFLVEINNSQEYRQLITSIITRVLEKEFPDFAILTFEQQAELAKAEFSKILQAELLPIKMAKKKENSVSVQGYNFHSSYESVRLQEQYEKIFGRWLNAFKAEPKMAPLRESIARYHSVERVNKLTSLLPALNNTHLINNLIRKYIEESSKPKPDYNKMEEEFLTKFLFRHLQRALGKHINFINLNDFNLKQANSIAKRFLEAANKNTTAEMSVWLESCQNELVEFIHKQLLLINGHVWQKGSEVEADSEMLSSLSYLFWHSKAVNKTTEFFNRLADAHAFIQYTGMSTQNESSYLALLDLYNYHRSAEQVTKTKKILLSLVKPFLPLYQEYEEIAFYEKSVFRKVFRTVMPLIVIAAFVVLVAVMLSPLAIPELAFLVAAIPALFLGIYLASKYVTLKNKLYQDLRRKYYGGPFEIPEFKINQRMKRIFGSNENAEVIRGIYIDELKTCDELEKSYSKRAEEGLLSEQELAARKKNSTKRHSILLEWYDIHSNNDLGYEKIPQIVRNRLNELADEEVSKMQKALEDHDLTEIQACVTRAVNNAKIALASPGNNRNIEVINDTVSELDSDGTTPRTQVAADNLFLFFRPKLLAHRDKAAKLENALDLISDSNNAQQAISHF